MKERHLKKATALSILTILLINFASGEDAVEEEEAAGESSDTADWHKAVCANFNGAYARRSNLGLICCGNETLFQPIEVVESWETNPKLDECTLEFPADKDSDMPTAFWNVWFCVLSNSSAFPDNKVNFKNYFNFVTSTYPKDIKTKILTAAATCKKDGDSIKDNVSKLQKFAECFHKSENTVCHKPYEKSIYSGSANTKETKIKDSTACPGMEGLYGTARIDYCCKKKSVPFNFLDFYIHFPHEEEFREKEDNCTESIVAKQMSLDPKLKAGLSVEDAEESDEAEKAFDDAHAQIDHCPTGCEILQKDYTGVKDLILDYEKAVTLMVKKYGTKTRTDLEKIISARKSKFQYHSDFTGNKTLTFDELKKEFDGADEMNKIRYYCGFAASLIVEIERALHEYCLDKEHADKWFEEHHT